MKTIARVAAGVLCFVVVLFAGVLPASADTTLVESSPKDGSTVAEMPKQIKLAFNGKLSDETAVVLQRANGGMAGAEESVVSGKNVTIATGLVSSAGGYTVSYRVVAADGHPATGQLDFKVGEVGETATPAPSAAASDRGGPFNRGVVVILIFFVFFASLLGWLIWLGLRDKA